MISYIGGKYKQAHWMYKFLPNNFNEYAEVFGGAFWFYLRTDIYKKIHKAYYNDYNRLMVNLIECSKPQNSKDFLKYIKNANIIPKNRDTFNKFRDEFIELEKTPEIKTFKIPNYEYGIMYPYVLTHIFSGAGIRPKSIMMNFGDAKNHKYSAFIERLKDPEFQEKMSKVQTSNLDFEEFVKKYDKEDIFMYFDPPYYKTEKYYSFHNFGREDHLRLVNILKNMKGKFMVSYYNFPELEEWFPKDKYHWEEKDYKTTSSGKLGRKVKSQTEVIIMNYDPKPNLMEEW